MGVEGWRREGQDEICSVREELWFGSLAFGAFWSRVRKTYWRCLSMLHSDQSGYM